MVNSEEFTKRINRLLAYYNLSAAAFAEKLGVGRSSISHIISGRNKPSLEFVLHILESFNEVSFEWLVYGKGNFPNENNNPSLDNSDSDLFSPIPPSPTSILSKKSTPSETVKKFPPKESESPESSPIQTKNNHTIDRIVIFYTNGNFKEYRN